MNERRVTVSKYAWLAAIAAFVVVFGLALMASSPGGGARDADDVKVRELPARTGQGPVYADRVAPQPPLPPAPIVSVTPVDPQVTTSAPASAPASKRASALKPKLKKLDVSDMFPVGDIMREAPTAGQSYRQIAERYPSFTYQGRLWSATGRYVHTNDADLVSTGLQIASGQYVYALSDANAGDVLFVRSQSNPDAFAVYRAS